MRVSKMTYATRSKNQLATEHKFMFYPADGRTFTMNIWKPLQHRFLLDSKYGRLVLEQACLSAGATIVDQTFTDFGEGSGYTGVLVLAQSHCSIHTYPDRDFAAIDIYTCGPLNTQKAVTAIVEAIIPIEYHVHSLPRPASPPSQNRS